MIKNTKKQNFSALLILCTALAACDTDFDNPVDTSGSTASRGDADFTTYVAIGDSLTAGYADGTVYLHGQENSFPQILANQFKFVGGGNFTQPLVNDDAGGLLLGGAILDGDGDGINDFLPRLVMDAAAGAPEPIDLPITTDVIINPVTANAPYNNMGVPGAKSFHLNAETTPGSGVGVYGNPSLIGVAANPYYVRFATSPTATVIGDALAQTPTFFTLWIGNNDVLLYATDGGTSTVQYGLGQTDLTDPVNVFAPTYNGLVAALTANPAAKGVLINIPDVRSIPYFSVVPYNAVELTGVQATAIQSGLDALYNQGLDTALFSGAFPTLTAAEVESRKIRFSEGEGNRPIIDASEEVANGDLTDLSAAGIPHVRQATENDLIVFPAARVIGTENTGPTDLFGLSPASPLSDGFVLIPLEQQAASDATAAYNATIQAAVDANPDQLVLYDANSRLAELASPSGINYGTGVITATYFTGGGFSLDGVHPTARGYAVVANEIIDTINTAFNASIPRTDPGAFTTVFIK